MSITTKFNSILTVLETLSSVDTPTATAPVVTHDGMNEITPALSASSSPAATVLAAGQYLLSGTTGSIDLTAIASTNGATVTGNGLKVQQFKIRAQKASAVANTGTITLKFGASNPYNLLGASWQIGLTTGESILDNCNNGKPVIGSGAKQIDISGTSGDGFEYLFVMG